MAFNFKDFVNSTTYKIEAKEADYLYTLKSQIPGSGNGLFTAIPIYKDEVISVFEGEILSNKEAKRRATNKNDGYFINLPDGATMDSMHVACFAKYANDALGAVRTKFKTNSKISLNEQGNVCIVANKHISIGEEIFCNYGKAYWRKHFKK
jgi:SET domain-containing protein